MRKEEKESTDSGLCPYLGGKVLHAMSRTNVLSIFNRIYGTIVRRIRMYIA